MTAGSWQTLENARRRGTECVSNLVLDQLALDELPEVERARALSHLEVCHSCDRARAALASQREAFLTEAPIASLAADALARASDRRHPARWRLGRFVAAPVLAAGAAVVLLWPRVQPTELMTRVKGGFHVSTFVLHREGPGPGAPHAGEPLHPGDRLQFRYAGDRPAYLAVVAVDARKEVSVYYPPGDATERVEAGRDVPLRTAVELDDTLGPELVLALRCERSLPIKEVVAAARRAVARLRDPQAPAQALPPLGLPCAEVRQSFHKEPSPGGAR